MTSKEMASEEDSEEGRKKTQGIKGWKVKSSLAWKPALLLA